MNDSPLGTFKANFNCRQIFSKYDETELTQYLMTSAKMYHGLFPKHVRRIEFQLAMRNVDKDSIPPSWLKTEEAGKE